MSIVPPHQLHHRVLGPEYKESGPRPLVLLHGLMGFSANWGKIWPFFQDERPVLVLDQRGHGRSAKPEAGYSPADYAGDLASLLKPLGWGRCHIVGHSMGGRVALFFAILFPEHTLSLTLEDSGMESNPQRINWIKQLLGSIPTPFADRESAKEFFAENFKDDPMTGGFLHANLETKSDGRLDWRFFAPGMIETIETGRAKDGMKEFLSLQVPTLVIRGSKSKEFPKEEYERLIRARENISRQEIQGAGHFVHAEKPQEFSMALKNFISAAETAP